MAYASRASRIAPPRSTSRSPELEDPRRPSATSAAARPPCPRPWSPLRRRRRDAAAAARPPERPATRRIHSVAHDGGGGRRSRPTSRCPGPGPGRRDRRPRAARARRAVARSRRQHLPGAAAGHRGRGGDGSPTQQADLSRLNAQKARWSDPAYVRAQAGSRLFYVTPGTTAYRVIHAEGDGRSPRPATTARPDRVAVDRRAPPARSSPPARPPSRPGDAGHRRRSRHDVGAARPPGARRGRGRRAHPRRHARGRVDGAAARRRHPVPDLLLPHASRCSSPRSRGWRRRG